MVLLSLALASGGLAASQVSGTVGEVERRVGRPVAVVVAARDLAPQRAIRAGAVELRKVPARFVPPGAVSSVEEVSGLRPAVPVAAGSYLTEGQLEGAAARSGRGGLAPGERSVEIGVGRARRARGRAGVHRGRLGARPQLPRLGGCGAAGAAGGGQRGQRGRRRRLFGA
jgi:Flp pilus assembly protein CpaB